MDFWNSITSSSDIVNSATLISVVFALFVFTYQEIRDRRQKKKEVIRLKDEIINLIIRNHLNSDLNIARVDLNIIIEGFEKLKDCKMNYDLDELVKMVYAKVYENEHISKDARFDLLTELEELLSNLQFEILSRLNSEKRSKYKITPFLSATLVVSTNILWIYYVGIVQANYKDSIIVQSVYPSIMLIGLFLLIFFRPHLDRLINFIFLVTETLLFTPSKYLIEPKNNINNIYQLTENDSISIEHLNNEIEFSQIFDNNEAIVETFKQRAILEHLLMQLYTEVYNEEKYLPVQRIVNMLTNEVLDEKLSYQIKRVYSFGSFVIHKGKLPMDVMSFKELIYEMKYTAIRLDETIKHTQSKKL